MEIVFLGTGNAFGSGGRHPIAILVRGKDFDLLLDCGPAILPRLKQLGRTASAIDLVLISHHHGDHFAGVPFLLLEYQYEHPRRRPLTVAGPPGTGEKLKQLSQLLFPGLESKERQFDLSFWDVNDGERARWQNLTLGAFRVRHFPGAIAFGYRLELEGRTIVYSGDTEWTDELARQSDNADLFICECSSFEKKLDYHMSYRELEAHRDRLGARRTILLHAGEDVLARRSELAFELAEEGQEVHL